MIKFLKRLYRGLFRYDKRADMTREVWFKEDPGGFRHHHVRITKRFRSTHYLDGKKGEEKKDEGQSTGWQSVNYPSGARCSWTR